MKLAFRAVFVTAAAVLTAATVGTAMPGAVAGEPAGPTLPTANAKWDYQIGKPYVPRDGVTVVSRDREANPLEGAYTMCYVNAYQTQPGEVRWWKNNHPRLLLKKDGKYVVDGYWGEILLDVGTAAKREQLASIIGKWIDRCGADGFQAIEPDNLDSWTRSRGQLTRADAFDFAALMIERSHNEGLAIGQKNASGAAQLGADLGFDFAVAEECGRWRECNAYIDAYIDQVYVIEYRDQDFDYSCERWGDQLSIILRDRMVTAPGSQKYVYRAC
jgi:hypothetical protein